MAIKDETGENLSLQEQNELKELQTSEQQKSGEAVFVSTKEKKKTEDNNDLLALNIAGSLDLKTGFQQKNLAEAKLKMTVNNVTSAIVNISQRRFKETPCLRLDEFNSIKAMLAKQDCNTVEKQKIESALTFFQDKIKQDYTATIQECMNNMMTYETAIDNLEEQKRKIIVERLTNFSWPFNETTRAYDNKIFNLKCKLHQCRTQLEDVEIMGPAANEKDIVFFNMFLKEQFAA